MHNLKFIILKEFVKLLPSDQLGLHYDQLQPNKKIIQSQNCGRLKHLHKNKQLRVFFFLFLEINMVWLTLINIYH